MAFIGVGAALRAERLRQSLSLAEIARRTCISQRFLTEIEAENFSALPGAVFARNFVRTYASELKMDAEPLLAELPRPDMMETPLPNPLPREPVSGWDPRWNSALASVAWIVLAVGAATAAYLHFNKPSAPLPTAQPAPRNAVTKVDQPHASPSPPPASLPQPAVAPVASQFPVNVTLTARELSWVQITADGQNSFTGVLQVNDKREVSANQLVKVVAGNAGGVAITLNGKPIDPLGPEGQVRTVRLTAEGPQLVLKTPPPPSSDPL